jgi:hypothetical protein
MEGRRSRSGVVPIHAIQRKECQITAEQNIIKDKVDLLEFARQLGNVSSACTILGYFPDSFYRYKQLCETGGEQVLKEISQKKPNLKNRIAPELETRVINLTFAQVASAELADVVDLDLPSPEDISERIAIMTA